MSLEYLAAAGRMGVCVFGVDGWESVAFECFIRYYGMYSSTFPSVACEEKRVDGLPGHRTALQTTPRPPYTVSGSTASCHSLSLRCYCTTHCTILL